MVIHDGKHQGTDGCIAFKVLGWYAPLPSGPRCGDTGRAGDAHCGCLVGELGRALAEQEPAA